MDEADKKNPIEDAAKSGGLKCSHCGTDNLERSNFCRGCGTPMASNILYTSHRTESASARIPKHLSERIRRSRSELQDARKLVTVMFADIRGSFELIEGRDPEAVGSILDELVDLMISGVHRYDGIVAQVLGDGIMALFGAPIADEAHAVRGAYAALAIHEAVDEYCRTSERKNAFEPKVRIGLHSGEVMIGTIRNDLSFDYRATGVTTHMAARMEQIATPGETRMTSETVRLAEGLIDVTSYGLTTIKGVSQPIEIFSLDGRTSRTRFQAHALRGLSPFVGRETDLEAISSAYAAASDGHQRSVVVGGMAGVGKSRLCLEFIRRVANDNIRILEASAFNYAWAPYAVIGALLRSFLGVSASDSVETIAANINSTLQELDLTDECRPVFSSILNIKVDDQSWAELDPAQLRHRTYASLRSWLTKLCKERPLVIFLDDLHWFDNESLEFLHDIVIDPPDSHILLLLTHRPEFKNPWSDIENSWSIQLRSLDADGTRELIADLVGNSPSLQELRPMLANWTQGNPFFVEETVRSLVEDSTLVGEFGAYELSAPNPSIELAPSIESVVAARIDRLTAPLKDALRAAAAIGAEIPGDDLRAVLGIDQAQFDKQMVDLQESGLMRSLPSTSQEVFRFKHAIVREVAYRSLLRAQRRVIHERIVRVFESLYADRLPEKVDQLADHAFTAELWDDAAKYYMVACRRAAARSANHEAVRAMDRGLRALDNLPSSDEHTQAGIDLRLRGLASLLYLGQKKRIFRQLRKAEYMARSIGDEVRLGAVNSQLATALWVEADHELALEAGELALQLARKHKNFGLEKAALSNIASVHHSHANFEEAIRIHRGLVRDFSGKLERKRFGWPGYPSVFCRAFLGSALTFIGEFDEAVEVFELGMKIADEVQHPYSQTVIREELAYCLLWLDRKEEALELLEKAQLICTEYDIHTMFAAMSGRLAVALSVCDRSEEAIEIAKDALDQKTYDRAGRVALNYLLIGLATAYAQNGDLQLGIETAQQAEEMTAAAGESAYQVCSLALLGAMLFRSDRYDEANGAYSKARNIAQRTGMRPLEAQCLQGEAEIYLRTSRESDARVQLESAIRIYNDIGLIGRSHAAQSMLEIL